MRWPFAIRTAPTAEFAPADGPAIAVERGPSHPAWELAEGTPIVEGRLALRALGGGSRYEAYLAWDERMLALVVAKVLRPHLVSDERALRELRREAEVLGRVAHPGLLRGFGAVLDGPRPHLVLEHVEGPSLGRLVKKYGALSMEQLLPLALQLASALHCMAADGFVHLDVKPSNVVMGVPPRLIDLSIARTVAEAAALRDVIGTDAYMAPEQCDPRGGAPIGPAADVFGLGATLHHAACGVVPFPRPRGAHASEDPAVRFPQLRRDPEPLPSHLPAELRAVVSRMLARDPSARPTAAEVASALEPLVAGVPARPSIPRRGGLPLARARATARA